MQILSGVSSREDMPQLVSPVKFCLLIHLWKASQPSYLQVPYFKSPFELNFCSLIKVVGFLISFPLCTAGVRLYPCCMPRFPTVSLLDASSFCCPQASFEIFQQFLLPWHIYWQTLSHTSVLSRKKKNWVWVSKIPCTNGRLKVWSCQVHY